MIEWKKWSEVKPERNVMILAYNKKWKNLGNHGDDGIRYGFCQQPTPKRDELVKA